DYDVQYDHQRGNKKRLKCMKSNVTLVTVGLNKEKAQTAKNRYVAERTGDVIGQFRSSGSQLACGRSGLRPGFHCCRSPALCAKVALDRSATCLTKSHLSTL